jgi:predicted DNA-binding transcriptional regulator AlpA
VTRPVQEFRHRRIPPLAGLAEVAALAGVSRKRAWQLTQHKAFPAPVQMLAMGPVWLESDVKTFLAVPRPAGRKGKVTA